MHYALAVAALVHIDEVDDDDAAEISQANLANDFFDRVHVGFDDGVFEARGFAYVLAGVDVDGDQRFGLVDDDVAAALEPDFRLERLIHFFFEAELLEQRRLFGEEFHALHESRLKTIEEAENALVLRFSVDPDYGEVRRDLVAQHALDYVEIVIDQRGRLGGFGAALDVVPEAFEKADVGAEFVLACVLSGGANDEAAVAVIALAHHDALEALALFVGRDLARDSGMVDRRHVDQETSGQRDVAGDARAFLADWLFGNLHQDFLTFF